MRVLACLIGQSLAVYQNNIFYDKCNNHKNTKERLNTHLTYVDKSRVANCICGCTNYLIILIPINYILNDA